MILLLLACEAEDDSLPDEVAWAGFVYVGDSTDQDDRLAEGELTLTVDLAAYPGEQPYDDYPGFWEFVVPPAQAAQLRIEGTGVLPTLWAGDTPTKDANWLGGSIFGATEAYIEAVFEALGEDGDDWVPSPENIDVLVIGVPSVASWTCPDVGLDVGGEQLVRCWGVDESGNWLAVEGESPAALFAAIVPAGTLHVRFLAGSETYTTEPGDVVLGYYLLDAPS